MAPLPSVKKTRAMAAFLLPIAFTASILLI
jgi:hypothetical protein